MIMKTIGMMLRSSLLLAVGLVGFAGCNSDKSDMKSFFEPMDENRKVNRFINVQADEGARKDSTLQAYHFDGKKLNSLGLEKLDRLIPDEPDAQVVVYLNLSSTSDLSPARKDDVVAYLGECGIDATRVKVENGNNPETASPAAAGLSQLSKTESGGETAAADSKVTMK